VKGGITEGRRKEMKREKTIGTNEGSEEENDEGKEEGSEGKKEESE
jgi:hypothetical protein